MQRCKRDGRSEHRFDSERVWDRDTTETLTFLDRADIKINQTCLGTRRGRTTKCDVTRKDFFFVCTVLDEKTETALMHVLWILKLLYIYTYYIQVWSQLTWQKANRPKTAARQLLSMSAGVCPCFDMTSPWLLSPPVCIFYSDKACAPSFPLTFLRLWRPSASSGDTDTSSLRL